MPGWIDQKLNVHAQAMIMRGQRAEILASNLANADTPGYKARDIDFRKTMQAVIAGDDFAAGTPSTLRTTNARHISTTNNSNGFEVGYRIPHQMSMDGNTVETYVEQAEFGENAVRYQASLNFLDGTIKGISRALKGE